MFKLMTFCYNNMLNHHLFQKFKPIKSNELNVIFQIPSLYTIQTPLSSKYALLTLEVSKEFAFRQKKLNVQ
jgi:hypothetical protein